MNIGAHKNFLPYHGDVFYSPSFLKEGRAQKFYDDLKESLAWERDRVIMFGKMVITKRKTAWYGSQPFAYTYSKVTRHALPWTQSLSKIKQAIEHYSGHSYNACLANFYHNGREAMGWHKDNEKEIVPHSMIASLSLGSARKFSFKHDTTKQRIDLMLDHGDLLLMGGSTQEHWYHCLRPTQKVQTPRINLTFRRMII